MYFTILFFILLLIIYKKINKFILFLICVFLLIYNAFLHESFYDNVSLYNWLKEKKINKIEILENNTFDIVYIIDFYSIIFVFCLVILFFLPKIFFSLRNSFL